MTRGSWRSYTLPAMHVRTTVRRLAAALTVALGSLLAMAPIAMAADGVGLYGRTDDKVITFFAFGVMIFFTVLVIVLSLVQGRLDSRKERRKQDLERLGRY
jgi:hypothetical protein